MKKIVIFLFLIIISYIYIYSLAPTITTGDSGELITSAYTLGISHPPGYPLYVIIGKIFSCLPIGSIGFRLNLMSVFFAICSLFIFYNICNKLFYSNIISVVATFIVGISYTFWSQTIISEVHTLHIFIALSLIWMILKKINLRIFSLLLGLGLCNHHTLLVFVPLFIYLIIDEKKHKDCLIYFNFMLGLSLYLFLPLRSLHEPVMNWGEPNTFNRFTDHVLRAQFGGLGKGIYNVTNFFNQISFYLNSLFQQISIFTIPLFLFGLYYLFKKNKKINTIFLYLFLCFSIGIILVTNFKIIPYLLSEAIIFFILSFILYILITFYGLDILLSKLPNYWQYLCWALLAAYCVSLTFINIKTLNKKNDYFLYDYGMNIFKTLSKKSILFIQSNHQTFALGYLNLVENRNKNIKIFDREENFFPKIFSHFRDALGLKTKEEIEKYFINKAPENTFFGYKISKTIPYGILYALIPTNKNIWNFYTFRGLSKNAFTESKNNEGIYKEDLLTRDLISMIFCTKAENYFFLGNKQAGVIELDKAESIAYDIPAQEYKIGENFFIIGEFEKAIKAYDNILKFVPKDFEVHNNLGMIYNLKKDYPKALFHFNKAISINPNIAEPCFNIGVLYQDNNDFKNALFYLEKAAQLDTTRYEIFYNLGIIYFKLNNLQLAETKYLAAISKKPDYILAYNNLALLYLKMNEPKKAFLQLEKALEYDTTMLITHYNLARVYERIDKKIAVKKWENYILKAENIYNEKGWVEAAKERIKRLSE